MEDSRPQPGFLMMPTYTLGSGQFPFLRIHLVAATTYALLPFSPRRHRHSYPRAHIIHSPSQRPLVWTLNLDLNTYPLCTLYQAGAHRPDPTRIHQGSITRANRKTLRQNVRSLCFISYYAILYMPCANLPSSDTPHYDIPHGNIPNCNIPYDSISHHTMASNTTLILCHAV